MNQLVIMVKNILKNKNTVTILCVIAGALVLWAGYNARFNAAVNPKRVPFAISSIQPRTKIEKGMYDWVSVPSSMIQKNVIQREDLILGKYVNFNTVIPEGSLFYSGVLVDWDDMPDAAWGDIDDGNTVVALPVDVNSTLGNSIYPGNFIDLYYYDRDIDNTVIFTKLIESIQVLSVKDKSGNNVFEDSSNIKDPAYLLFSVPESLHLLLRKALFVGGTLIPVQRNKSYSTEATPTRVVNANVEGFILEQTSVRLNEGSDLNEIDISANDINDINIIE